MGFTWGRGSSCGGDVDPKVVLSHGVLVIALELSVTELHEQFAVFVFEGEHLELLVPAFVFQLSLLRLLPFLVSFAFAFAFGLDSFGVSEEFKLLFGHAHVDIHDLKSALDGDGGAEGFCFDRVELSDSDSVVVSLHVDAFFRLLKDFLVGKARSLQDCFHFISHSVHQP